MNNVGRAIYRRAHVLVAVVVTGLSCAAANGAVTLLGVQYQQDNLFPEFNCIWNEEDYPPPCSVNPIPGCNVHVYLKNTGGSSVTLGTVYLAGEDLSVDIKADDDGVKYSIYFRGGNDFNLLDDAGEPVWYRVDPSTIPAGGVAQAIVRLRHVPTIQPVSVGVATSAGMVNATIPVDANAPQLASVSFPQDLTRVYLHWRVAAATGGAAPVSVWMDGIEVTASTTTVGDPTVNFAASVIQLAQPLSYMSYHVFKGLYADGKTAMAGLRAWPNPFIYGSIHTFNTVDIPGAQDWIIDATNHGLNAAMWQLDGGDVGSGGVADCMGRSSCRQWAADHGYKVIVPEERKKDWSSDTCPPLGWFIFDEPDAHDTGPSPPLPAGEGHNCGLRAMSCIATGERLRNYNSLAPTILNLDATYKPTNYYNYGQTVDVLMVDSYYQRRMVDAYWRTDVYPHMAPLYQQARDYIYGVSRGVTTGAEPNPSNVLLYSCEFQCGICNIEQYHNAVWPFPTPESKRMEAYYALAGGAKGIGYWWFQPNNGDGADGLNNPHTPEGLAFWKEIGRLGNEMKTAAPLLVTSHPVDMTLTPSTNVWAKALASGTDTIILLVVNDDYYNDINNVCNYTPVTNATVTATLPSWMQFPGPSAFEISANGLSNVSTQLIGDQLVVSLGTLNLTRMIVVTTNPSLRATIQQRYEEQAWPGVCAISSADCLPQNNPPSIAQHPASQTVVPTDSAIFAVFAGGNSTLTYQWQKNQADLTNGGHYSGCTTPALAVSLTDTNDVANYRCVVTNPYGTATSNAAALTLGTPTGPTVTQPPSDQSATIGGTATFTVIARGYGTLSYQWQKNQAALTNGGHYSGTTSAILTITGADRGDEAAYRCVVSNGYGSATSDEAALSVITCVPYTGFQNGDFEDWPSGNIAPDWTGAYSGTVSNQFVRETTIVHGGTYSQKTKSPTTSGAWTHVYQEFDTNVGDALTISGYLYSSSAATYTTPQIGVNASNTRPDSWLFSLTSFTKQTWIATGPIACNASGTSTYFFLESKRNGNGDTSVYWDDVSVYHAHVPPAPTVGNPTGTTLDVNVDPGCNSTNAGAEYAVGIGGGGYALGSHWVQANGSVGTTAVWRTDAAWAARTVTGLVTGTTYTFEVKARYNGTYTQETSLGAGATGTPSTVTTPTITQHPGAQNACPGANAQFAVTADGPGTLTYQWQKNQANLSGGGHYSGCTTATLSVTGADSGDAAGYRCVVTNAGGSTNSNGASLTLKAATAITAQPSSQSVIPGGAASFSITATGDGALTYQWQKNGSNVTGGGHYAGCTTATLTVSSADSGDAASYRCVVTAGCGSATSNPASLTVGPPPIPGDFDHDLDVDLADFGHLQNCLGLSTAPPDDPNCADANLDNDAIGAVDQQDVGVFIRCMTGEGITGDPNCAN